MNAVSVPTSPAAVVIHHLEHGRLALAAVVAAPETARPLLLVSARDAGCFMGPAWWRALVAALRAERSVTAWTDLLDCGDAAGRAMEALRLGQRGLVLAATGPQYETVRRRAAACGATLWPARPDALDLAVPGDARRLSDWIVHRDNEPPAG